MNCLQCGSQLKEGMRFCPGCGAITTSVPKAEDPRISMLERALGKKYKILHKIGAGGFAEVYLGEHTQLGRKVAIKILHGNFAADEGMVERFRRESKAAAKLAHPNIIDIYDVGEGEGLHYFVMKYVEGDSLAKKMQRDVRMDPSEAIQIVKQIADALAYAHDNNVIHRDIKPGNVMLDTFGKPVLMDFGIARAQFEGGNLTKTGTLMGTPHYLPPEQPLGKPVDGRSDIYSLGIMFYEMLAGHPPFHDENAVTLIFKHINEPPPPLKDQVPDLEPDLCAIVHTMMEKAPEARYQTAAEVVLALETLSSMYPTPASYVGRKSTPGTGQNTERLMLLAEESLQQERIDKAIEIYATLFKRDPTSMDLRGGIEKMASMVADRIRGHLANQEYTEARTWLTKLQKVPFSDSERQALRKELDRAEQASQRNSEFKKHFEAAQTALQHQNAPAAIENLTKALTVDPDNPEAQKLLREARAAYEDNKQKAEFANAMSEADYYFQKHLFDQALSAVRKALEIQRNPEAVALEEKINAAVKEKSYRQAEQAKLFEQVDRHCEELNFKAARDLLDSAKADHPEFVQTKIAIVDRNRALLDRFTQAKTAFDRGKLEEAMNRFQEFLEVQLPYDFQVFYTLRKEAEQSLAVAREKFTVADADQRYRKADAHYRMGQLDKAREECLLILQRNSEHQAARQLLENIESRLSPRIPQKPEVEAMPEVPQEVVESRTIQVPLPKMPVAPVPEPPAQAQPVPEPPIQAPVQPVRPPVAAVQPEIPAAPRKSIPIPLILGGVGAVAAIALIVFLIMGPSNGTDKPPDEKTNEKTTTTEDPNKGKNTKTTTTPTTTTTTTTPVSVSIDAQPWAMVEITPAGSGQKITERTPCRIDLPAGKYSVLFTSPNFQSFTQTIEVSPTNREFRFRFDSANPEQLAETLLSQ